MSNIETQFTTSGSRIAFFRNQKKLSQQSFAETIGVSRGYLADVERDRSDPSSNLLTLLASKFDVSIDWILTGKGSMHRILDKTQSVASIYETSTTATWDDFELITMYTNVEASAGNNGAVVYDESDLSHLAFKKDWLRQKGLQSDKLSLIRARGDSMEPTLYDGDILLVDNRADRVIDDSIYIIQADHHLVVKRLQQALDGSLLVISDNPRYEKQRLNPEQVAGLKIAGRVCWYGHEI